MFGLIRNQVGERLDYSFGAGENDRRELVIIGHGVTANKDREWAIILSDALNLAGYATLRFSFSGNGDSEGDFRQSCPSKEVADLHAILQATENWQQTYAGHSMGGAVGVLSASKDPRIRRLISLAGMVDTADFAQRKFGTQQPGVDCMWEKPECPLSQEFLDDMKKVNTVESLASNIIIPWLLIHGTEDTVVPLAESEGISGLAKGPTKMIPIPGADHVFSGNAAEEMAQHVVTWMQSNPA